MQVGTLHLDRYLIVETENGPAPDYSPYVKYRCLVCESQDDELYGSIVYRARKSEIKSRFSRCGCVKRPTYSRAQWSILVARKCKQHGAEFLGFVGEFIGNKTLLKLKQDEDVWETTTIQTLLYRDNFTNPVKYNRERKSGALARKPDEEMIANFLATGVFAEGTKFTRNLERKSKHGVRAYWDVFCPICNATNTSRYTSLQQGQLPCGCCKVKPPIYAYIHSISDSIIKFGIKNSFSKLRLKQQSAAYGDSLVEIGTWKFDNSQLCRAAELYCKRMLICPVISKNDFPDGYTETTYSYNISSVTKIYEDFGGVRCPITASELE